MCLEQNKTGRGGGWTTIGCERVIEEGERERGERQASTGWCSRQHRWATRTHMRMDGYYMHAPTHIRRLTHPVRTFSCTLPSASSAHWASSARVASVILLHHHSVCIVSSVKRGAYIQHLLQHIQLSVRKRGVYIQEATATQASPQSTPVRPYALGRQVEERGLGLGQDEALELPV